MSPVQLHFGKSASFRTQRLKEAVLSSFYSSRNEVEERFAEFSANDWKKALFWLDISGLALYLLDRLASLELEGCLPEPIRQRLQLNLVENRERTAALFNEAVAVSKELEQRGIAFALLKGITLTPESVPNGGLRMQTDLDFLVAASDVAAARHCLLALGYTFRAISGDTLEFKAGISGKPDIRNIYRVHSERALELHLEPKSESRNGWHNSKLSRARPRCFRGIMIPALSPADTLVFQGQHLFKHLCGEHTRASWALEFWRHIQVRRNDAAFWSEVESVAASEPRADLALGAATSLAMLVFGQTAPEALTRWTTDRLPFRVRQWVETYGRRVLLSGTAGSKLYLILREQLEAGRVSKATVRRLMFPTHLPPPITHGEPGERLMRRLERYCIESRHMCWRLRFHVVEGVNYAIESSRWGRRIARTSQ